MDRFFSASGQEGDVEVPKRKQTVRKSNGKLKVAKKFSGWWQLKHFLFSPRKLGKMNPF